MVHLSSHVLPAHQPGLVNNNYMSPKYLVYRQNIMGCSLLTKLLKQTFQCSNKLSHMWISLFVLMTLGYFPHVLFWTICFVLIFLTTRILDSFHSEETQTPVKQIIVKLANVVTTQGVQMSEIAHICLPGKRLEIKNLFFSRET